MFSCCLQTTRGSGLRKARRQGLAGVWRRCVHSRLQRLWPFSHRDREMTPGSQAQNHTGQGENESALMLDEPRVPGISADKLEKLVNHLVPSLQGGDPFFVSAFLYTYRRFATTQQVLDLLFKRHEFFRPHCKEDEQVKNTIHTLLETWLDIYPEDFCQSSDLSILNQLMAYLLLNMPCSELSTRVHVLLSQIEDQKSSDSEDEELGSHTSADPELEAYLPAVKPAALQPEPAGALGAGCGSSGPAGTSADCYGSSVSLSQSGDREHFSHLPPLQQWVCLLEKCSHQPRSSSSSPSSLRSADRASSVRSLRLTSESQSNST